jgi:hypothetical protein
MTSFLHVLFQLFCKESMYGYYVSLIPFSDLSRSRKGFKAVISIALVSDAHKLFFSVYFPKTLISHRTGKRAIFIKENVRLDRARYSNYNLGGGIKSARISKYTT